MFEVEGDALGRIMGHGVAQPQMSQSSLSLVVHVSASKSSSSGMMYSVPSTITFALKDWASRNGQEVVKEVEAARDLVHGSRVEVRPAAGQDMVGEHVQEDAREAAQLRGEPGALGAHPGMIVEPLVQGAMLEEREAHARGEGGHIEAPPEVSGQRPEPGLVGGLGEGDVREVVHR